MTVQTAPGLATLRHRDSDVLPAVVASVRATVPPRQRLTSLGYTRQGGSPTAYQVRLAFESRWRRVYVYQTSNLGSTFYRTSQGYVYVHLAYNNDGAIGAV